MRGEVATRTVFGNTVLPVVVDLNHGEAEWRGRKLRVVDTGGILPEEKDFIPAEIFRQAKVALEEAEAVILVIDARTELASPDMELARLLMRTGKPLFLE